MNDTLRLIAGGGTPALLLVLVLAIVWFTRREETHGREKKALLDEIKELQARLVAAVQAERDQNRADQRAAYEELVEQNKAFLEVVARNTADLAARAERDKEVREALASVEVALRARR